MLGCICSEGRHLCSSWLPQTRHHDLDRNPKSQERKEEPWRHMVRPRQSIWVSTTNDYPNVSLDVPCSAQHSKHVRSLLWQLFNAALNQREHNQMDSPRRWHFHWMYTIHYPVRTGCGSHTESSIKWHWKSENRPSCQTPHKSLYGRHHSQQVRKSPMRSLRDWT